MVYLDPYSPSLDHEKPSTPHPQRSQRRKLAFPCVAITALLSLVLGSILLAKTTLRLGRFSPAPEAEHSLYTGAASIRAINNNTVLIYKTGHSVIYDRLPMQLIEPRPDIPNRLVYSDVKLQIGGHTVIDALENASVPEHWTEEHKEYRRLQCAKQDGLSVAPSKQGWKLDRYKFAPITTHAWKAFPNATWFIIADGDTYIMWSTLMRWLDRSFANPVSRGWYLGFDEFYDASKEQFFAHGGAGIIMSKGLLDNLHRGDPNGKRLMEDYRFVSATCGDCALGLVISKLPGRTAHTDAGRDLFHHDGLDMVIFRPRLWHSYLLSLHHNSAAELNMLRQWEKRLLPTLPEWDGVRYCDVLFGLAPPFLREPLSAYVRANNAAAASVKAPQQRQRQRQTSSSSDTALVEPLPALNRTVIKAAWKVEQVDGVSCSLTCLKKQGKPSHLESCQSACDAHPSCFQWYLNGYRCSLAINGFRIGRPASSSAMVTGWRVDRIAELERAMPCSNSSYRAFADERGIGLEAGRADEVNTGLDQGWYLPPLPNRPQVGWGTKLGL
ncbi:hypothetical protein OC846_004695 [Tilletia horrida]|uniref:N-acetylgalactosaminide beta-1,3-galactosyltransferase n=1 Tax=Tilletia horrida TaxID=155126 RepID=A0AAN6GRX3_9BASI|nr:hypothetical protein OC845_004994 [Tilletia horrida]KAK0547872.1 hypothetical protein OC846_004695 [Tilletia horrida]KAK0567991.1 hypothetical protein OC861_002372 [Tilletia horrida]